MLFELDRFDGMSSALGILFAVLWIIFLIAGLALLVFAWPLGLIVLAMAVVLFVLSFAIARTPNFTAVYGSSSGRRTRQYGGSVGFRSQTTMGGYQNAFQGQSIRTPRGGASGFNQVKRQNGGGLGWVLIIVGIAFFIAGLFGSVISFIYGIIFLYAGFKGLNSHGQNFSYGQMRMNTAPVISAESQSDGFD